MPNAFEPPTPAVSEEPGRIAGAGCLFLIAGGCAFVLVFGLAQDVFLLTTDPENRGPVVLSGMMIGTLLRTVILAVLGAAALYGGRALLWPQLYGSDVLGLEALRMLYARLDLEHDVPGDPGNYLGKSPQELVDVHGRIDAEAHPQTYAQLRSAIKQVVETDPHPPLGR